MSGDQGGAKLCYTTPDCDKTNLLLPISLVNLLGVSEAEAYTFWFVFKGALVFALMYALFYKLSHYFSSAFFSTYRNLPDHDQAEWNSRIVSNVNAVLMCIDMLYTLPMHTGAQAIIFDPSIWLIPIVVTILMCRFAGYITYDLALILIYRKKWKGVPSILFHHVLAFAAWGVFMYYGQGMWYFYSLSLMEGTTPFVNQHWFFTTCNMKDSKYYMYNGVLMFVGFFVMRVLLTTAIFIQFWLVSYPTRELYPPFLIWAVPMWIFAIAALNYFWFYKITRGMLRAWKTTQKGAAAKKGTAPRKID